MTRSVVALPCMLALRLLTKPRDALLLKNNPRFDQTFLSQSTVYLASIPAQTQAYCGRLNRNGDHSAGPKPTFGPSCYDKFLAKF